MEATMHEAKTNLSKLVARARAGEEIILTSGRSRNPIAKIVPVGVPEKIAEPTIKRRPIGLFKEEMGPISSDIDWFAPMSEEELALWEAPLVSTWKNNHGDPLDETESDETESDESESDESESDRHESCETEPAVSVSSK